MDAVIQCQRIVKTGNFRKTGGNELLPSTFILEGPVLEKVIVDFPGNLIHQRVYVRLEQRISPLLLSDFSHKCGFLVDFAVGTVGKDIYGRKP